MTLSLKRPCDEDGPSGRAEGTRPFKRVCAEECPSLLTPVASEEDSTDSPVTSCSRSKPAPELVCGVEMKTHPPRHPSLYFDDGDITLRAESFIFRVHKNKLMKGCRFFEDMLGLKCSDATEKTEDSLSIDVGVIESSWDMTVWLAEIYSDKLVFIGFILRITVNLTLLLRSGYFKELVEGNGLKVAASLFHLADKWDLPEYFFQAKDILVNIFPDNYDEWVTRSPRITTAMAFRAIPICKQYCPHGLPAAYYTASLVHLEVIISGTRDEEGTLLTLSLEDQVAVLRGKLQHCLVRREHTYHGLRGDFTALFNRPHQGKGGLPCRARLSRMYYHLDTIFHYHQGCLDPLPESAVQRLFASVCSTCANMIKDELWIGTRSAWDCVPDMFGLQSWLHVRMDQREIDKLYGDSEEDPC
ncbi:hypothetical protein GLOTRDRAFT_127950 [Gloeophyllum trabeum ATCC 11539]|uniref:BTB domain-containing protein n=1 Tax=Gloeophyllum trabeum (strain ATCC 11539 / FP-39264 / Madison 617) TaxID=670483 RepID=S7QCJ2_GLOTA|nr:uncharacterized protein GLOTRDRAFT_127950 [Gloeophyllum trabeum ATCC 11539]EPQ57596.1 hypothetical protein GLOTRDRAFT_127950 [Gloeophyllum trabeum ATCC 11539]